mmetsp:Transcript_50815/g.95032  ORF Transcript_50815/g.95032 Transcript_50815/m.95032 type:complete len:225 (+) Transcript_50815:65-739(+)
MADSKGLLPPAKRSGWLQVSEENSWVERFFVLHPGELAMYADGSCSSKTGSVVLRPSLKTSSFDPKLEAGASPGAGLPEAGFILSPEAAGSSSDWRLAGAQEDIASWQKALVAEARPPPEEVPIDDFSDYEEEAAQPSRTEQRSSISERFEADWTVVDAGKGRTESDVSQAHAAPATTAEAVAELPIDDFSDYEDDGHARRSSLADLDKQDWSQLKESHGAETS